MIANCLSAPRLHCSFTQLKEREVEVEASKNLSNMCILNRRLQTAVNPVLYENLVIHDHQLGHMLGLLLSQPFLSSSVLTLRLPGPKTFVTGRKMTESASKCKKYLEDTKSLKIAENSSVLFDLAKAKLLDAFPNLRVLVMRTETLANETETLTRGFMASGGFKRQFRSITSCESIVLECPPSPPGSNNRRGLTLKLLAHLLILPNLKSLEAHNVLGGSSDFSLLSRNQGVSKVQHLRLENVHDSTAGLQAFFKIPRFLYTMIFIPSSAEFSFVNSAAQLALGLIPSRSTLQVSTWKAL